MLYSEAAPLYNLSFCAALPALAWHRWLLHRRPQVTACRSGKPCVLSTPLPCSDHFLLQMERHNSQHASAEPRGKSPEETPEQQRKREDRLLEQAGVISALRSQLSLAFGRPYPEPARPKTQWDYLIEEMQWLHVDFAQVQRTENGMWC